MFANLQLMSFSLGCGVTSGTLFSFVAYCDGLRKALLFLSLLIISNTYNLGIVQSDFPSSSEALNVVHFLIP